jgi:hypothetical protein
VTQATLGAEEIREFLLHLRARNVSASTFNVYDGAIKFLYRVTLERPEQNGQKCLVRS